MSEPRDKLKIIGLSISGFVVMVMLVAWFFIWRGSQDIELPDLSDLAVEVATVAPEDNALTYVEKAISALKWDKSLVYKEDPNAIDLRGWLKGEVEIDAQTLRKTMEENQQVFEWLERAFACEHFVPPVQTPPDYRSWNYSGLMGVMDLLLAKVRWEAQNKRYEDAVSLLISAYRLVLRIQLCGSGYMEMLIGHAVSDGLMGEMVYMARDAEVPKSIVENMANQIPDSSELDAAFISVSKVQFNYTCQDIDHWLATDAGREELIGSAGILDLPSELEFLQGAFFDYRFHPNRTKGLFADHCRMYVANLPSTLLEARTRGYLECGNEDMGWQDALKSNALGTSLFSSSIITPYMFEKLCTMKYQMDSHRVALLLIAHHKEHGIFPVTLEGVDGLASIPIDPFDGKPMRYSSSELFIYTVGEDLVDDPDSRKALKIELMKKKKPAPGASEASKHRRKRDQNE